MFKGFSQLFSKSNKDVRKRLYFTLACLGLFCLGTTITVPWASRITGELGFLEIFNLMSGGGLENFSIFALGVSPYITASIITQLLEMDIVPYFKELKDQGYVGRQKINKITRYLSIVLAFIQGYMLSFTFISGGKPLEYMMFATILTAGTCFLLWIGDQITAKGVGNGISLLIMAGIIATMPSMFKDAFNSLMQTGDLQTTLLGITKFALFVIIYLAVIIGVVYVETSERRIPIQYANKTNSVYGANNNYMPFKINSAGVMPVIFASALISIPGLLASFIKNEGFSLFVSKYLTINTMVGFTLYIVMIIVFAYIYTFMTMKPKELAENLGKSGGFIPGIRPGEETEKYISNTLKRITLVGALFLAVVAALPVLFSTFTNLPSSVKIGGTGLIIVVGVALETYKQIESKLSAGEYVRGRHRR